jgi:hypothetical protein
MATGALFGCLRESSDNKRISRYAWDISLTVRVVPAINYAANLVVLPINSNSFADMTTKPKEPSLTLVPGRSAQLDASTPRRPITVCADRKKSSLPPTPPRQKMRTLRTRLVEIRGYHFTERLTASYFHGAPHPNSITQKSKTLIGDFNSTANCQGLDLVERAS